MSLASACQRAVKTGLREGRTEEPREGSFRLASTHPDKNNSFEKRKILKYTIDKTDEGGEGRWN